MSEATEILRSYVHLLRRLTGAASVSLYVPAGAAGEREILTHDGPLDPLPELKDAQAAASLHRQLEPAQDQSAGRLASASTDGVLYRIPLRSMMSRPEEDVLGRERRKAAGQARADVSAWIGLRFEKGAAGTDQLDRAWLPPASATLNDQHWWTGFLGLAAALAAHAHSVSNVVLDPVTGLPERSEFQTQVETALAHVKRGSLPTALLLLGPDDFGWVNERLDRRSGDQVLREIATGLRAVLRNNDHVARYGGAIFTVLLRDTAGEDSRLVAENVVRRLADHRYHGATLRLEFSAGVAIADPAEPIDPPELIRRADQALSAAKRGQAGVVRVWMKGSDVEHAGSLDRLQGIFTGDRSKDYRNMGLLLDSVAVVAASTDPEALALSFTQRLFETLHASRAGVFERTPNDGFELLGGIERSSAGTRVLQVGERDLAVLERACRQRDFVAEGGQAPGELSLCALPLFLEQRCLGGIVLEVTSPNVSFEGSDRKFLDALASQMAVALDRARLTERERQRQREEKERLEAEVKDLRRVVQGSRLAYRSAAMESVLFTARKVARTDTTVLITGESGTGKEMLAHTLHELSSRRERPFVVVDCGAISPTLIESELFGHERGAFTGAHARKLGRLAQGDGATVFLDEIGDIPLDLQSKLLRFVQEKQLTPVGSVVARAVDVRIIAATNADLRTKVAEGKFREDLFHRLNVVRLQVPPLRERREDIVHLASLFLQQFSALYRRPAQRFTPRAETALQAYPWPGNVRELQNTILTCALFCDTPEVDLEDLKDIHASTRPAPAAPGSAIAPKVVPAPAPDRAAPEAGHASASSSPALLLSQALAGEVTAALGSTELAQVPIGKWLAEDLVLTAERLSKGRSGRGADLLGLPETTYRRQLQIAVHRRAAGLAVRSPSWPSVARLLEDFIRARRDQDVCQWAEACLLSEVEAAAPGDARRAAALLGVTEPTLLKRKSKPLRRS